MVGGISTVTNRLLFGLEVYESLEMTTGVCTPLNGCLGSGHHCIIWLCGLSAMLEKVIAFSSHCALRFLCTMRIGCNS
jgi:hypothetical protein